VHLWIAFYRALANISWEHVPFYVSLDACKQALDNRPNPSIPMTDVLSMIRLPVVLENNCFSFNGKHYLQVEGTSNLTLIFGMLMIYGASGYTEKKH
jgi:hypothetical protein